MAERVLRATLVITPPSVTASVGITTKLSTHDTVLAMVLAGIAGLVALWAVTLVLRAELLEQRTTNSGSLTESAIQTARFRRATSSFCLWWLFPKHAKDRREAAAAFQPLAFQSTEDKLAQSKSGQTESDNDLAPADVRWGEEWVSSTQEPPAK
jgi:hypothetical protein